MSAASGKPLSDVVIAVGETVRVRRPGRIRGFLVRIDEEPVFRANGYVKIKGWRVRRDGVRLNWTSEYVPVEYVSAA